MDGRVFTDELQRDVGSRAGAVAAARVHGDHVTVAGRRTVIVQFKYPRLKPTSVVIMHSPKRTGIVQAS